MEEATSPSSSPKANTEAVPQEAPLQTVLLEVPIGFEDIASQEITTALSSAQRSAPTTSDITVAFPGFLCTPCPSLEILRVLASLKSVIAIYAHLRTFTFPLSRVFPSDASPVLGTVPSSITQNNHKGRQDDGKRPQSNAAEGENLGLSSSEREPVVDTASETVESKRDALSLLLQSLPTQISEDAWSGAFRFWNACRAGSSTAVTATEGTTVEGEEDHREGNGESARPFVSSFRCSLRKLYDKNMYPTKTFPLRKSHEYAGFVGAGVLQKFPGWMVNLKQHDLEVSCLLNIRRKRSDKSTGGTGEEDVMEVSIGVTLPVDALSHTDESTITASEQLSGNPLLWRSSSRVEWGRTALNPCIAYCLSVLADIRPGDIVIDPFSGVGTIPIEAGVSFPDAMYLGGDIDKANIYLRAKRNVGGLEGLEGIKVPGMDLVLWDASDLPLRSDSVDVVVTDLPWGHRELTHKAIMRIYPRFVKHLARILRPGTGRAVVLTQGRNVFKRALRDTKAGKEMLEIVETREVVVGCVVVVFVLRKKDVSDRKSRENSGDQV
ncbi:THUMP domain-containing protein 3 [Quaeritorhiza haematococci]|nr:THUMP domain-containing protein 3 [Quaeritorhiza haematococci]